MPGEDFGVGSRVRVMNAEATLAYYVGKTGRISRVFSGDPPRCTVVFDDIVHDGFWTFPVAHLERAETTEVGDAVVDGGEGSS